MYATSADWKVNDGTWSTDQEKTMTTKMKSLGALHWFFIHTGDDTGRSVVVWPDKETAHAGLTTVRDEAAAEIGNTITATCEGEVNGF